MLKQKWTSKVGHRLLKAAVGLGGAVLCVSCFVDSACYNDADCSDDKHCVFVTGASNGTCVTLCKKNSDCKQGEMCDSLTGDCFQPECTADGDCRDGFTCEDGNCVAVAALSCPEGMVPIERSFCIDIYEASRPDADEIRSGSDDSMATSRAGVIPWLVDDNAEADAACRAAGKRLCTESEWYRTCIGPDETVYAYGDEYTPDTCNGIDAFCHCDGDCADEATCPFPYCYASCGADFHLTPTGQFADCTNGYGVYDINGNLWEHVLSGDETRIRGGAYNCKDSKQLHRCDYIPGNWTPSAPGFRCCAEGTVGDTDAGDAGDGK